jgi:hypothetical protein
VTSPYVYVQILEPAKMMMDQFINEMCRVVKDLLKTPMRGLFPLIGDLADELFRYFEREIVG